ncbi:transglycosylase domain-containing protein [Blattabacterium cuenoti]|uniref:transglycosylase domain-containing protein n=1 Tax=Blattabacterium cuenoti TaxID=1653831 RepID=UPI00163C2E93|nr:transglycosylase domain-containing protein [Blattabacterium cuenoti]
MNNKKKLKKNTNFLLLIFYFWIFFFLCVGILFTIFYAASNGYLGQLPTPKEIENPLLETGTKVYDTNGILLGKFFSENRVIITYKQLPKDLIKALIAKEDIRFEQHSGIDIKSLFRAILSFGKKGGGSTISQQLAKLLFTGQSSRNKFQRMRQKILEWIMAIELERRYTKEEIITMYYNKFDFLYNAKGIESASHTYFNKKVSNLNLNECAILVGMLENPSLYNPKNYPIRSKKQRNLVLYQMKKYNFINGKKYKIELKKPINLNFKIQKRDFELLTYYGEFLKKEIQDYLNEYEKKTGKKLNLYSSELKIYTSIDAKMQKHAEKSVKKHLVNLQNLFNELQRKNKNTPFVNISKKKTNRIIISSIHRTILYKNLKRKGISEKKILEIFRKPKLVELFTWNGNKKIIISPWDLIRYKKSIIQAGLLSIEPKTGYIKAWVGGVDFNHFQYDHVFKTHRQVGSIFKPILYAAAINKLHYNPCTKISNERFQLGNWAPRNSNGKYGGFITLKDGLAMSVNTISARLISKITIDPVIDLAKKMGIQSIIPKHPSIALGSADLTLYEITGAFNTFTNYGYYIKPSLLMKIEDKNGNLIKGHSKLKEIQVFNKEVSYIMLDLMRGVVEYGTAKKLHNYNINGDIIGKTGTTNDNSDGWFIGMIPNLTTGIWVGWEDRFVHFENIKFGQGSFMALPIWAYYINSLYKDTNLIYNDKLYFQKPKNFIKYCCNKNKCNYSIKNSLKKTKIDDNYIKEIKNKELKTDDNINKELKTDDNINKELKTDDNINKELKTDDNINKELKTDDNINKELKTDDNINKELKTDDNINKELKTDDNINKELKTDDNINKELKTDDNINKELKTDDNINKELKTDDNINKELKTDDNINKELKTDDNINKELKTDDNINKELKTDDNINKELKTDDNINKELKTDDNINKELKTDDNINKELKTDDNINKELKTDDNINKELKTDDNINKEFNY